MAERRWQAPGALALLLAGGLGVAWLLLPKAAARAPLRRIPHRTATATARVPAVESDPLLLDPVDLRASALAIRQAPLLPPPAAPTRQREGRRPPALLATLPRVASTPASPVAEPPSFWLLWAAALGLSSRVLRAP